MRELTGAAFETNDQARIRIFGYRYNRPPVFLVDSEQAIDDAEQANGFDFRIPTGLNRHVITEGLIALDSVIHEAGNRVQIFGERSIASIRRPPSEVARNGFAGSPLADASPVAG